MLAVLCSAPRPPLGVALLGLFIAALKGTLYLLPYALFFSMIGLSLWTPSSPALPDVVYYPVHGQLNMVSVSIVSSPTLKTPSFTLGADLRILIFLLCLPVSSIVENILFRPARDFFLETVVCWFEMRYVQPAQATGLWPDTWAPILNALRSYEFVADFLDGVTGNDLSPSLVHEQEAHAEDIQPSNSDSGVGRCDGLQICPTKEKASPSRRAVRRECRRKRCRKHISNSDLVSPGKQENSPSVSPPQNTYISPPRVSPLSPWVSNGSGILSPISKNLSRMVAILFHHPPLRKPVIRRRFNLKATAHSARAPNVDPQLPYHSRLWTRSGDHDTGVSGGWTPMSSLKSSTCNPVEYEGAGPMLSAWQNGLHDCVMEAPARAECISEGLLSLSTTTGNLPGSCEGFEIQPAHLAQRRYRDYGQLPNVLQVPEPPIQAYPQCFVSNWQEEQPSQPQPMQIPVYHAESYHHQQPPAPVLPMAYEPMFHCSQSTLDLITCPQRQYPDLDIPEQFMADPPHAPPAEEKCANHASQSRFFEDTPGPVLSRYSASYTPVLEGASACPTSRPPAAFSSIPRQVVPLSETVSAPGASARADLYAPNWVSHQPPAMTNSSPQPYVVRPFRDLQVTESYTFDVLPHTATPSFNFSHNVPPATSPCSRDADAMSSRDTSLDAIHAWQSAIAEHLPMQSFSQIVYPPSMLSTQPPAQPQEVIPQTISPTESAAVMTPGDAAMSAPGSGTTDTEMDADSDDDSCSGTDSEIDSDSESSDDDSDSDSSDDEGTGTDTGAHTQGPARNNPAKNMTLNPALDTQSTSQNAASIPNKDQSSTAPKDTTDKDDTDEDSDGDTEYIPPPPGESKLADDSSSDSDMSDHEEEDRIYWEQFYSRHRR